MRQFTKVELFSVVSPGADDDPKCLHENSDAMLQEILAIQEEIVKGLGLDYRILRMGHEELGASAYEKYDIEVWMNGLGKWGEASTWYFVNGKILNINVVNINVVNINVVNIYLSYIFYFNLYFISSYNL